MSGASANLLRHVHQLVEIQRIAQLSDRQLLERFAAERDEAMFALLMRRHGPMVLSVCRRILGHEQDAEDAFQATFLILARKAGSIRQTDVGGYLYRVAYHVAVRACANAAKRKQREKQGGVLSTANPQTETTESEIYQIVDEELQRLPEDLRSALVLCYLEGKTQEEAARRLGWSKSTLRRRLDKGRELLRSRLLSRGLTPMAALTASLFAEGTAPAAVSAALAETTLRSAMQAVPMAPAVATLVNTSGTILSAGKAKAATVILFAATLLGGAGLWAYRGPATSAVAPEPPAERREQPRVPAKAAEKDTIVFRGRVLDPNDKPIAGAKVYYHFITHQEEPLPVRAVTDVQGRFIFALSPKDIPLSAEAAKRDPRKAGHVVVKADGFTFAWQSVAEQQADLTLHVSTDSTPLAGRIIDLQGKPLAGLRVTAWSIAAPEKGDLTPFVKALRSRASFIDAYYKYVPNRLASPFYWRPGIALLPATTTDANGRFRLHGFAKDQLVELRIEGPAMETQNLYVMTRLASKDSSPLLSAPRIKDRFFGPDKSVVVLENGFDHPVPPGLTVAGTVRDAETKRPIPRAIVESYVLAGTKRGQNTLYHTVADNQGRYRFTGLPRGKGNRIRIRPPADQPYVPAVKDVPLVKLFSEANVDVALNRGVWVDVTTADKTTGRPVPGSVSYFVLPEKFSPDDPFAQPFFQEYNNNMAIRNDGTFRFAAIPRRAIIAFQTDDEKYPIAREAATIYFPFGTSASNFQAFAEINPKPGDGPVKVKFVLDAGRIVKGKLLDPQGRPLAGAVAVGLNHDDWEWEPARRLQTADFTAVGLDPDRPRLLCFIHMDKKLAGSVVARGDQKTPLTVRLQPWATVSGRLLDAEGKPISNATLWFTEVPVRKPGQPMSPDTGLYVSERRAGQRDLEPHTDEQGRFHVERLIPGLKYNLALMDASGARRIEQIKWQGLVFAKLILKAGESKELGDVKLQPFPRRNRHGAGETSATPPPSSPPAAKDKESEKTVSIHGRVLDPDGKPAANVRVYADPRTQDEKRMASTTTGKDGRFSFLLARSRLVEPKTKFPLRNIRLLAIAKGYGLDWLEVPLADVGKEATLRLVKDDVPIQGRILSLEGKPLAGIKVSVQVIEAFPKGDLDRALQAMRKEKQYLESTDVRILYYRHHLPHPSTMATTDADGRFRLQGIGRERLVTLNVEGPGIYSGLVQTMTRRGESVRRPYPNDPRHAASFDYLAKPARLLRGTVREQGTGKPLAGIRIHPMGFTGYVTADAVTDERGHYELHGCPKGARYGLMAYPNHDQPYLLSSAGIKDTPGFEPLTADLEMVRGIPCEGKVLDGETGQPWRGTSAITRSIPIRMSRATLGLATPCGALALQAMPRSAAPWSRRMARFAASSCRAAAALFSGPKRRIATCWLVSIQRRPKCAATKWVSLPCVAKRIRFFCSRSNFRPSSFSTWQKTLKRSSK